MFLLIKSCCYLQELNFDRNEVERPSHDYRILPQAINRALETVLIIYAGPIWIQICGDEHYPTSE